MYSRALSENCDRFIDLFNGLLQGFRQLWKSTRHVIEWLTILDAWTPSRYICNALRVFGPERFQNLVNKVPANRQPIGLHRGWIQKDALGKIWWLVHHHGCLQVGNLHPTRSAERPRIWWNIGSGYSRSARQLNCFFCFLLSESIHNRQWLFKKQLFSVLGHLPLAQTFAAVIDLSSRYFFYQKNQTRKIS